MKKNAFTMAEVLLVAVAAVLLMMGLVQIPKYEKVKGKAKVVSHGVFACMLGGNNDVDEYTYYKPDSKEPLPALDSVEWINRGADGCWKEFNRKVTDLEIPVTAEMLTINLYGGGAGGQSPQNEWVDTVTETVLTNDDDNFIASETGLYSVEIHGQNATTTYVSEWNVKNYLNNQEELCIAPAGKSGLNGLMKFRVKLQKGDIVTLSKTDPSGATSWRVNIDTSTNHLMHPFLDRENHPLTFTGVLDSSAESTWTNAWNDGFLTMTDPYPGYNRLTPCPATNEAGNRLVDNDALYNRGDDGGNTALILTKSSNGNKCFLSGVTGAKTGKINCVYRPLKVNYICTARFEPNQKIDTRAARLMTFPNDISIPTCDPQGDSYIITNDPGFILGGSSVNGGSKIKLYTGGSTLAFAPIAGCGGAQGKMSSTMLPFMPDRRGERPVPTKDQVKIGKGGDAGESGGTTTFGFGSATGGESITNCSPKPDKNEGHDGYSFPDLPIFKNMNNRAGKGGHSGSNTSHNAAKTIGIGSGGGGGAFGYTDATPPEHTGVTNLCTLNSLNPIVCRGSAAHQCTCGGASKGGTGAIVITW